VSTPHSRPPAWAWLAYAASALGLLVLAVLPGHKYAWMEAVDPAVDPTALVDGSGNRVVFATVVMLLAVGLQGLWLLKAGRAHGTGHRVAPCLLIAAVLALWMLKF
jgi:ABC-type maltose transport system permease subunit